MSRLGWLRHLAIAATQQHHLELREVFAPLVPREAVVVDVGAHAGQFAKLFARMAPDGVVHALEPSAYARSVLGPALAWNRVGNVRVHPFGLSDVAGEAVLQTPIKRAGDMGFGLAHLGAPSGFPSHKAQAVALTTLDAFAEAVGLERLDLLKADIEGWEVNLLRGGAGTLARFRPALFLELHVEQLARAGATASEVWDLLTPLGYRARIAPDFTPVDGFAGTSDYLFTAG